MDDPLPAQQLSIIILNIFNNFNVETLTGLALIFILLLFSGLISASEIAFFSLTPTNINEINSSNSKLDDYVIKLLEKQKRLLATILISNNLVNIALIIISTYISNSLINFSLLNPLAGFTIQVVGITFIILLFGEVIPKIYATKNALKLVRLMCLPLQIISFLVIPLSSLLIGLSKFIDKHIKQRGLDVTVEELSQALDLTSDIPENQEEHKILKGIVKFGETNVKQVMTARVDVVALDKTMTYKDVLNIIIDSGYSRIPVYENSFDTIVGVIYIKDLLAYTKEKDDFDWNKLIRPPFFVPENKKLDDLLTEFQETKIHLAIVVDEYGGTSGIVSLEDILEEIVGEISDEFDDEDITYSKLDDNNFVFDGKTPLLDVFKIINLDSDDWFGNKKIDAETIAGLVIEIAEKIPQKNERITYKNITFIIEASDKRKVKRIKISIDRKKNN